MPIRSPTLAAIRRACPADLPEGTIRLLFIRDGGRVGLVQTPHETANDADQFLALYLERMITDVAAPGVVVAVVRAVGRPTSADRQLWTMLGPRIDPTPTSLLDLIVVGQTQVWSARRGRPVNQPRRRRDVQQSAARRSASRSAAP